jgi:phosphate acetyltransferase
MSFIERIYSALRRHPKRIVFPEGNEPRVMEAAGKFRDLGLGTPILLGDIDEIRQLAEHLKISLKHIKVIDPTTSDDLPKFVRSLERIQRFRNMNSNTAVEMLANPNYFACMMTNFGHCDGLVGGSAVAGSKVLRPIIQLIRFLPQVRTISGCTIHEVSDGRFGDQGVLFFADTGVIPEPSIDQLAGIGIRAGLLCRHIMGVRPRVAMLSFSTKSSSTHRAVEKMVAATELARQRVAEGGLEMDIDGELQADAALIPGLAEKKAASSLVAGQANVLVFPDLNSSNIASKLVHHLGGGNAFGQILLGLSNPAGELSRGVSVDSIVAVAAIVGLQAIRYRELYDYENSSLEPDVGLKPRLKTG